MKLEEIKKYCLSKSFTSEDFPFGPEPLVTKVGSKIFAILNIRNGKPAVSLKCDPFIAENLRQQYPSLTAGYHLNKLHWNTVMIDGTVPESELFWMIDHSYELVYKSLSKAEKANLSIVKPE